MNKYYFRLFDLYYTQAIQQGYINEEGIYCYVFNMILTSFNIGNADSITIDFDNVDLNSNAAGKFVWYMMQYFDENKLSKIKFTNISIIQYRQLQSSYMSYNQKAYEEMRTRSQNIDQLIQEKPEIKQEFDSLVERWAKINK